MAFKKAERTRLYLRCALFGPSGSGKTMTALRMAKGIADKAGVPFAVIDTEARSASKYADRFAFDVDDLGEKTIDHYIKAMEEAAKAGYKVLVIDSLSHAWRELTDEVDRIAQAGNSKNTFSPWAKVNPKQKRFIDTILNFPGHIIATMRSKTEWVIGENKSGKTVPQKIGLAPEQGKGIEYEFDILVELNQSHEALVTKDRTGKFQDEIIEKPGETFGVELYDWLGGGNAVIPAAAETPPAKTKPAKKTDDGLSALKESGKKIISEIGEILAAASEDKEPYFSEAEKEDARQIIKTASLNKEGIAELEELKTLLTGERVKRESVKAQKDAA
ncbi:hypothetical protein AGMMS50212_15050 [Spirochaetia bacterium]|nr:hypothetical protein AGMMS50212_15050 [Spirochaetia bacterium]